MVLVSGLLSKQHDNNNKKIIIRSMNFGRECFKKLFIITFFSDILSKVEKVQLKHNPGSVFGIRDMEYLLLLNLAQNIAKIMISENNVLCVLYFFKCSQ